MNFKLANSQNTENRNPEISIGTQTVKKGPCMDPVPKIGTHWDTVVMIRKTLPEAKHHKPSLIFISLTIFTSLTGKKNHPVSLGLWSTVDLLLYIFPGNSNH